VKNTQRDGTPVLITEAAPSYDEQFAARRKRYSIMMGMRIPFLVTAAFFYHIPWLALLLILVSIPLPWCAVLIANDRPARKAEAVSRYRGDHRALEAEGHQVLDSCARPVRRRPSRFTPC